MITNANSRDWTQDIHGMDASLIIAELLKSEPLHIAEANRSLFPDLIFKEIFSSDVTNKLIPFLMETLSSVRGNIKAQSIQLLTDLACGGKLKFLLESKVKNQCTNNEIGFDPLQKVNDAVGCYRNEILYCLNDDSFKVRQSAAQLMAVLQIEYLSIMECIEKERTEVAKADMLFALGWFDTKDNALLQMLKTEAKSHRPLIRAGAILGLVKADPDDLTALWSLFPVLSLNKVKESVWCEGAYGDIALKIILSREEEYENGKELLLEALPFTSQPAKDPLVARILQKNFQRELRNKTKLLQPQHLSLLQKSILQMIVSFELTGPEVKMFLNELKLPQTPKALSCYLSGEVVNNI